MQVCENCGRVTSPKEPTHLLYQYKDIVESIEELTEAVGIAIARTLRVCVVCHRTGVEGWRKAP